MRRCSLKQELKKTLHSTKDMKMRHFWCLFYILTLPSESFTEENKADKINGTFEEAVTFHLKTSEQSATILWLKMMKGGAKNIASVQEGQPCQVNVFLTNFKGRLDAPNDCKSLQIHNLHQEDSGEYIGQINDYSKHFRLEVYKNLSKSNLEVQCENYDDGNYTWQLNCSAGKWGNGVNYSWTSTSTDEKTSSHVIQIHNRDGDANYTCTVANPVSKVSKTVSIKEACEGNKDEKSILEQLIPLWIVLAIVTIAAACIGCILWKRHKKAAHRMPPDPTDCTVPDESNKTIYVQIGDFPSETQQTGRKKPQPQKRQKAPEGVHTIYSCVQPKPTTLQTDDEKIQMEGQGASKNSEKTTYSTVNEPQEIDDSAIKTVYDTVNAPRHPEGSEFRKLL